MNWANTEIAQKGMSQKLFLVSYSKYLKFILNISAPFMQFYGFTLAQDKGIHSFHVPANFLPM